MRFLSECERQKVNTKDISFDLTFFLWEKSENELKRGVEKELIAGFGV